VAEPLSPEKKRGVWIVWLVIFIDLLGFGIVLPSLAYFVHLYPVPELAAQAGRAVGVEDMSAVFVGLIQTSYSLMQFVFAPIWGSLSDRIGRRPVLLLSVAGFAIAWTIFGRATSLGWLLLARSLAGAMGANVSTAQAYMADVFPKEQRAKGMGLIGMAFGLGFVFGPAFGAILISDALLTQFAAPGSHELEQLRLLVPSTFAAGFSAIAFFLGLFKMPESLAKEDRRARPAGSSRFADLRAAVGRPFIGVMLFIYFGVILGFSGLETMFSVFNLEHLHLAASVNATVFTAIGVTMAIVQGGLIGPLTKRLGGPRVLAIGLFGLSGAMTVFGLQTTLNPGLPPIAWVVITSVVVAVFFSLCNPSALGIISTLAAKSAQGEAMGITSSAATLGRILGPIIGGVAYARLGPPSPFLVGAGIILCAFVFLVLQLSRLVGAVSAEPSPTS
jgi:MFS transporter, DHA1 family, tetracycline resistance protein